MLTALQAKEKTNQVITRNNNCELEHLNKLILETIEKGCYSITHEGQISKNAVIELSKLGYIAKNGTCRNEPYFTINWEVEKNK